MKLSLLIFFIFQLKLFPNIVINEFMALPEGEEPEWIEIYNYSGEEQLITSLQICDSSTCKTIDNIQLKAHSFNIFTKDTNALKSAYDIPTTAHLFETSIPILNNSGDQIIIKIDYLTIDSLFYDKSVLLDGASTERKNYLRPANSKINLSPSQDENNATPGKKNSNLAYPYDLAIDSIFTDDNNDIYIRLYDIGFQSPADFTLDIFADFNRNGEKDLNEGLLAEYLDWNAADYSMKLKYDHMTLFDGVEFFGEISIVIQVSSTLDENYENDRMDFIFSLESLSGTVLINEIMFEVGDNSAEFIELYNKSDFMINLKNWQVLDKFYYKSNNNSFIDKNLILKSGDYAVIAWDSLLFDKFPELKDEEKVYISSDNISLNNDQDLLILISSNHHIIDSLTYSETQHDENLLVTKDISLERFNLLNSNQTDDIWTSSADPDGATPLRTNSVSQKLTSKYFVRIEPNPVSFKNDYQQMQILYNIPFPSSFIDLVIYDEFGNEIFVIADALYSEQSGSFLWNGTDKEGREVPEGLYICSFSARKSVTNEIYYAKKLIVIGNS